MSRFITDLYGTAWRLDLFERFERFRDAEGFWVRGFRAGDLEGVRFIPNDLHTARGEMVAAAPGFFTLDYGEDGKLIRLPVVAWWTLDGETRPVTLSNGHWCEVPVQGPDGSVEHEPDRCWPNLEAWKAEVWPGY